MSYFILMTSKLVKTWVRLHPYSIQGISHWIIHRPLVYWPINTLPKQIFQYYVRNFLKTSQLYPFVLQGIEIRYLCELNYRNLESHQDCTAQIYVYGYVITIYPFGPRHCPCEFVYLQLFRFSYVKQFTMQAWWKIKTYWTVGFWVTLIHFSLYFALVIWRLSLATHSNLKLGSST